MTASDDVGHPRANPRQRLRLEQAKYPVTDPLAQDYAAWRGMLLRWTVLIVLASALLGYKVNVVVGDEDNDSPQFGVFVLLILVLGLLFTAVTGFVLVAIAA